jgi:lysophospholipase L1-like esterase
MKKIVQLIGAAVVACVSMAEEVPQALKAERPGEWWMQRHDEKVAAAALGGVDLIQIGDSITHYGEREALYTTYYGHRNTLNLGFGGDGTQNVLWRLQNGEIDGLSPKLVVLMIGTNNAGRDEPADIVMGTQAIITELRTRVPNSEILLVSIFPRAAGAEHDCNVAVNAQLASLADGVHVFHMDINSHFVNGDGSLKAELYYIDLLHLSSAGYQVWWEQMEPFVSQALGDAPVPNQ